MKIEKLYEKVVKPELVSKNRRRSTISSLERAVRRFNDYEKSIDKKIKIKKIKRKTLLDFRNFLATTCNTPTQNITIQAVTQLLKVANHNELIKTVPHLEPLQNTHKEYKIFPSDNEICDIWNNCKYLNWPRKDSSGNKLKYSPEVAWKTFILFLRTFGLRTQELVQL
jgi:hypothetical protein